MHGGTETDWPALVRYFSGESPPDERAAIETWIAAARGRASEVAALRRRWQGDGVADDPAARSAAWEVLVVTLRLGARDHGSVVTGATLQGGAPGRVARRPGGWPRAVRRAVAAAGIVTLGAAVALVARTSLWRARGSSVASAPVAYATRTGERAIVTLHDGTRVTLAPRSRLSVLAFSDDVRTVALDGEAYFEIPRASGAPFLVRSGAVTTRVLGTAFVVRHYAADSLVRVAVTSGKVNVAAKGPLRPNVTLTAGYVGYVTDSLATVRASDDLGPEAGWLNDELVFHDAPMSEVLATLTRWYGYEFRVADPALARRSVTLGLSTRSSSTALSTLEQVLDVKTTVAGDTVTLTPNRAGRVPAPPRYEPRGVWTPSREVGR